ncbi:phage tail assembly chaperone [Bradyrhizobium sp. cf659]|uniref:phage tail assembly chaperone n=1 Tax=Bradyrhizobium sp. cf659 TaxID=1761771 RepID=UPI0008EF1E67|nr:phage tail assembly chaperone [Bradyrhizobium sp. cf659]SFH83428.1 Phage tail assembly chaperone protein, TAC [Bradyrhizobium sp. cf659]
MVMPLAYDELVLTLSPSVTLALRPSLRAAFRLNEKYDGFQPLYLAIREGNLTAINDLIDAAQAGHRYREPSIAELLAPEVIDHLLAFIPVLCGANDKGDDEPQTSEPISFEESFTQLYQIGTGWLGWTPEATWNATPAEIINAKEGRVQMLAAIFGKRDDTETIDATKGMPADLRKEINAIGRGQR